MTTGEMPRANRATLEASVRGFRRAEQALLNPLAAPWAALLEATLQSALLADRDWLARLDEDWLESLSGQTAAPSNEQNEDRSAPVAVAPSGPPRSTDPGLTRGFHRIARALADPLAPSRDVLRPAALLPRPGDLGWLEVGPLDVATRDRTESPAQRRPGPRSSSVDSPGGRRSGQAGDPEVEAPAGDTSARRTERLLRHELNATRSRENGSEWVRSSVSQRSREMTRPLPATGHERRLGSSSGPTRSAPPDASINTAGEPSVNVDGRSSDRRTGSAAPRSNAPRRGDRFGETAARPGDWTSTLRRVADLLSSPADDAFLAPSRSPWEARAESRDATLARLPAPDRTGVLIDRDVPSTGGRSLVSTPRLLDDLAEAALARREWPDPCASSAPPASPLPRSPLESSLEPGELAGATPIALPDPSELASLIGQVLYDQARRHGVDFT